MPFNIEIDKGRLAARVSWEKSSDKNDKEEIPAKELLVDLVNKKSIMGVGPTVIDEAYDKLTREGKLKGFLIAQGTPPTAPRDGEVKWLFDTTSGEFHAGKREKSGGIDYRERRSFVGVDEEQLIGEWVPPALGKPGQDVCGQPLLPSNPKQNYIVAGKNVRLSDDGTKCYSTIKGHVFASGLRISVDKIYNVEGDVDFSTGNIRYPGNILVSGNVKEGFTIEAEGDVVIDGIVENAEVHATGNIVVKGGVLHNSYIEAEGDLEAKFIHGSRVKCGGKVTVQKSIIKSTVNAKKDITVVNMRKSYGIVGGEVNAGYDINTYCIGTELGVETKVCAGNNRKLFLRIAHIVSYGMKIKGNIERFNHILELMKTTSDNKMKNRNKRRQEKAEKILKEQQCKLDSVVLELRELKLKSSKFTSAKVNVFGTANEGAVIGILGMMKHVKQPVKNSLFYFDSEKNKVISKAMAS